MKIDKPIRWIAGIMAVGAWVLSIAFSVAGFGFTNPDYKIAGVFLALLVTLFEVLVNREGSKLPRTLLVCGLLAYIYGIATNFLGLYAAQGSANLQTTPQAAIIPAIMGILLEVFPEPLLLFSLGIRGRDLADTIAVMMGRSRSGTQVITNSVRQVPIAHQRAQRHQAQYRQPPNNNIP